VRRFASLYGLTVATAVFAVTAAISGLLNAPLGAVVSVIGAIGTATIDVVLRHRSSSHEDRVQRERAELGRRALLRIARETDALMQTVLWQHRKPGEYLDLINERGLIVPMRDSITVGDIARDGVDTDLVGARTAGDWYDFGLALRRSADDLEQRAAAHMAQVPHHLDRALVTATFDQARAAGQVASDAAGAMYELEELKDPSAEIREAAALRIGTARGEFCILIRELAAHVREVREKAGPDEDNRA